MDSATELPQCKRSIEPHRMGKSARNTKTVPGRATAPWRTVPDANSRHSARSGHQNSLQEYNDCHLQRQSRREDFWCPREGSLQNEPQIGCEIVGDGLPGSTSSRTIDTSSRRDVKPAAAKISYDAGSSRTRAAFGPITVTMPSRSSLQEMLFAALRAEI